MIEFIQRFPLTRGDGRRKDGFAKDAFWSSKRAAVE